MRLWSIHPMYLDSRGLVALWREGLLAKAVLEGKTRGYINHPQLVRFRSQENPLVSINAYLWYVLQEAISRGYNFDQSKICKPLKPQLIKVTSDQLDYEFLHLLKKLERRSPQLYGRLKNIKIPEAHPIVKTIPGKVEPWEIVTGR